MVPVTEVRAVSAHLQAGGWGVSVDAHPNPGSGVQHCWAGSLEVLRTTYCPDGLSGCQPGLCPRVGTSSQGSVLPSTF